MDESVARSAQRDVAPSAQGDVARSAQGDFVWAVSALPAEPAAPAWGHNLPVQPLPRTVRRSRWRKTPTTFGPAGRVSLTLALLVPLAFMVVGGLADPFVWGGAGFWAVVVMPLALRDIWKAGQLPLS